MRSSRRIAAVSLTLMLGIALAPAAEAFGGRGGRGGGGAFGGRASGFQQGFRGGFKGGPGFNGFAGGYNRSFPGLDSFGRFPTFRGFGHGFKGDAGFGWVPWGAPTVYGGFGGWPGSYPTTYYDPGYYAPVYAAPPAYPAPAVYSAPPVYAAPPAYPPQMGGSISLAPVPQTPPSVVAFPGGRYELRGDGVTTPYQWVWVQNPPPVPPAPPTAPPVASEPAPGGQSPVASAPAARTQLYRWTDDQGVVHWTNRAEVVPTKYRKQAKFNPDD